MLLDDKTGAHMSAHSSYYTHGLSQKFNPAHRRLWQEADIWQAMIGSSVLNRHKVEMGSIPLFAGLDLGAQAGLLQVVAQAVNSVARGAAI